jgi:pilus assembly protein CpaF
MCTIHANSPRDALTRLENMVAMTNLNFPDRAVRQQIAAAITLVAQVSRLSDGTRKVTNISEITGVDESVISMHEIFMFHRKGICNGKVVGAFEPSGIRPRFLEQLRISGVHLANDLFDRTMEVN